jgi:hypothetical protein
MSLRKLALVAATSTVAALGALAATAAQARSPVGVQVTIGAPVVTLPAPPLVVIPAPRQYPVHVLPVYDGRYDHRHPHHHGYRQPQRWDVDGDGIPNRYDRVYNPAWDRNGNGVPDRREFHRGHHPYGDRDRDGIPNRYDRRDDRYVYPADPHQPHGRGGR